MNHLAIPTLLLLALAVAPAAADVPVLSFEEVRVGMRGTGRTAFQGTQVVEFAVEIVGKLPNVGPGQNLILARCSGGPLAETGVLSGMSGSPVTVDGRLVGAVAYSWGFAKEAIAGITPIGEMLALARSAPSSPGAPTDALEPGAADLEPLFRAEALSGFLRDTLVGRLARPSGALPAALPISVAGVGPAGLARLAPLLEAAGLRPIQAGGAGAAAAPAPRLEPGSPMGVKLVRGDVQIAATGTVTWIEGDRILAFGHPLFGLGAIDLPLTAATVETLLPSLQQSERIATPLAEVGALRQDRASGVAGQLGARPRMIPVRFKLTQPSRPDRDYSFDVADDPLLAPLLLYVSLNGIVATHERTIGSATVRVLEGSVIKMTHGEDVEMDNVFAGPTALDFGTGIPAFILYLLMNNAWTRPEIAGINLLLDHQMEPRTAQIRRVSVDRYRVHAGDAVTATVVTSPYRGRDEIFTRTIRIPEETPAGPLTLYVGGAGAVSRAEDPREPIMPRDLEQLIRLINQLRRNDRIYIGALREDPGALLDGVRLPNLPPSVAHVLTRPRQRGGYVSVPRRSVLEETIATNYAVEGTATIEIEVQAP